MLALCRPGLATGSPSTSRRQVIRPDVAAAGTSRAQQQLEAPQRCHRQLADNSQQPGQHGCWHRAAGAADPGPAVASADKCTCRSGSEHHPHQPHQQQLPSLSQLQQQHQTRRQRHLGPHQQQQHQHQMPRLLSADNARPDPQPPAASGAPPAASGGSSAARPPAATTTASSSQDGQAAAQESSQQATVQPGSSSSSSSSAKPDPLVQASEDVEAAVDKMLDRTWQELKRDLKKEMSPEQAALIDQWDVSDIQTDKVFRDIAQQQLGPILQLMGIREDPYTFFIDMFKLALMLQLGSAAAVFYGAELGLGLDAGDAFRAVAGLFLGYALRLGVKIEHLAWPLYNAIVQLLITDDAVYEYPAASAEEKRDTLNRLGLAIGCVFLVPKFLFGWQNDECWQILVPMVAGLFLFDVCYILALLIKCWTYEEEDQ